NNENNEITRQAERFAETRGPFSQYVPHFTSNVNEIEVIKQLVKYTKDTDNFDLQIAAYRKSQVCPDNEYNILLFVETTESFAYLLNTDKWLPQLDNKTYQLKTPSILLQLSAVIQNVGFDIDIDEFSENVKELYPEIVNLVRLKNRAQRNFKTAKCIHCQQDHWSNATKCPIIKDYRAALTKMLVAHHSPAVNEIPYNMNIMNFPTLPSNGSRNAVAPTAPWAPQPQMQAKTENKVLEDRIEKSEREFATLHEDQKSKVKKLEDRVEQLQQKNKQLVENCNIELHEITGSLVDLGHKDGENAEHLLDWAVSQSLAAITPNCPTSLRSDREIDYALVTGVQLTVQAYTGNTTSDHKPIFGVLAYENTKNSTECLTYWKVFYFFLSYTHVYWETRWADKKFNENYDKLNQFLVLLVERCTKYFPIEMARGAIPKELRKMLSYSRALGFRAKRTGDERLSVESTRIRNAVRSELKQFRQSQLVKQLAERHKPGRGSMMFWNRTKKHF
ncbi:unnamed protein product, partial [Didymodactylos carnosus]